MPLSISRGVVLAVLSAPAAYAQTPGQIAGYYAENNVNSFLDQDLIQKQFETVLADESCISLNNGKDYWDGTSFSGEGAYLQTLPTYSPFKSGITPVETEAVASAEWEEFIEYFGDTQWHLDWVQSALEKVDTTKLRKFPGNFATAFGPNGKNTAGSGDCVGYEENAKKATAYTFNYLEAMQLMQKAIDFVAFPGCSYPCTGAVEAWDQSVAIYTGSQEGADGLGAGGNSIYALAEKRCANYNNCGQDGSSSSGIAQINTKILGLYAAGALAAKNGQVGLMNYYKKQIAAKMTVPFIQGTFRYSWKLSNDNPAGFSKLDKDVGEAAAFALGVIPKVAACSKRGASKIEKELKVGGTVAGKKKVNLDTVRLAVECNYKCLGVTCEEVGSLFDGDTTPRFNKCDDSADGNNSGPSDIAKCLKQKGQRKQKCKQFIGNPNIAGRDDDDYFVNDNKPPKSFGFGCYTPATNQCSCEPDECNKAACELKQKFWIEPGPITNPNQPPTGCGYDTRCEVQELKNCSA